MFVRTRHRLLAAVGLVLSGCADDVTLHLLDPRAEPGSGGRSGAGAAGAAGTDAASSALIHRYDFEGTGTTVFDRIGTADGRTEAGAELDGTGVVILDGVDDFVRLPGGLVSSLTSATVLAWVTWSGGSCWQRVFDFGNTTSNDEGDVVADSSFFLAPQSCGAAVLVASVELVGDERHALDGDAALPTARRVLIGVVVDAGAGSFRIVQDTASVAEGPLPAALSSVVDDNAWLGRSQYEQDLYFAGSFDEFRIYSAPLTDAQLSAIASAGPDAP